MGTEASVAGSKTSVGVAVVLAVAVATVGLATRAQQAAAGPAGPAGEAQRAYNGLKANILKAANNMPADAYSYKPTPDIRTFARVVNHISEAQGRSCGAANGMTTPPPTVPPETADKAAIVTALQGSFRRLRQGVCRVDGRERAGDGAGGTGGQAVTPWPDVGNGVA